MSRRRNPLRIALASAVVAGAVLAPVSTAFAAPHTPAAAAESSVKAQKPVKTQKLLDGSVAKIYKGAKQYRADIFTSKGAKLGTLDAKRPYLSHGHVFIEIDVLTGKVGSLREKDLGLGLDKGFHQARGGTHVGNTKLPGGHGNRAVVYQAWRYEHKAFVVWNDNLVAVLDAKHPQKLVGKGGAYLVKLNARTGKVTALKDKGSSGQGPVRPAGQCVVKKETDIGAGALAEMYNTPRGPEVWFLDMGTRAPVFGHLDRKHPSLPKSAGIYAKITNADSARPKLVFKTEGGDSAGGYGTALFPKLPKGCVVVNHVK
ncbi:hypothetical protein [Streptomyces sp. I05A-00742]|uniref:hypothetical protein n=1 Tax=Streptomyces sp. I05A-00742 TaxID=2732853 RepID=UPI001489CEFD|nr:hypothetical protein [Streptomyces sp. I05A-00742]